MKGELGSWCVRYTTATDERCLINLAALVCGNIGINSEIQAFKVFLHTYVYNACYCVCAINR